MTTYQPNQQEKILHSRATKILKKIKGVSLLARPFFKTNNMIERTLVLFKPDAMQRGLVGEGISRFEKRGLKMVALKMINLDEKILKEHYAHVAEFDFFPTLQEFMQSTPVIAVVFEGPNAVDCVRQVAGIEANELGTFRGDYVGFTTKGQLKKNLIHTSDTPENAEVEVKRFFDKTEIFNWKTRAWKSMFAEGEWADTPFEK